MENHHINNNPNNENNNNQCCINNNNNNNSNNVNNQINCEDTRIYNFILTPDRCTKRWLNASDTILSLFIISPLVVTHWRGTWLFMDNNAEYFPAWNCFIFGGVLHTTFALLRESLHAKFASPAPTVANGGQTNKSFTRTCLQFIFTKLYTFIFSIGCNMHWRGGWAVLQLHFGTNIWALVIVSMICFLGLICFKSVRNLVAPPIIILTDSKHIAFSFPTRFRIEGTQEPVLYVLDCLFSVLVIGTLVVFVWRGLWVLCDLKLYPQDPTNSAWGSLMIGYAIVGITFLLQSWMRWVCDRLTGYYRLLAADIFLIFAFVGTVNVWRGVWQLLDLYFLQGDIITHSVPFIILTLMRCSNSVLVRGVYIDAEEPAGQCVIFPVYFIRLLCQKERIKKQKKITDAFGSHNNNNNNNGNHNNNNNPNSLTTGLLIEKSTSIRIGNQQHLLSDLTVDHDHDLINNNNNSSPSKGLLNVSHKTTPSSTLLINTNYNNNIHKLNNTIDNSILTSSPLTSSTTTTTTPITIKSIDLTTNILNINDNKLNNDKINNDINNLSDEFTKLFPKDLR